MSELKKIYSDDALVHYAHTTVAVERTKMEIDELLAEFQIKDVMWHYDVPRSVYIMFSLEEEIQGRRVSVGVRVDCPTIWDRDKPKGRPPTPEQINWKVSMRVMRHFIKTHLETAYAMQSGKIIAFLPYVKAGERGQIKDMILPELRQYAALEKQDLPKHDENKVTEADYTVKE